MTAWPTAQAADTAEAQAKYHSVRFVLKGILGASASRELEPAAISTRLADAHVFPIVDELLPTIEAYDIGLARISAGLARLSHGKRGSPMRTSKQCVEQGVYHRYPSFYHPLASNVTSPLPELFPPSIPARKILI